MLCLNCSTENPESRKFCSECGSLIGYFCPKCGFHNSLNDKYCGGCSASLKDIKTSDTKKTISPLTTPRAIGKYSDDEISELLDDDSQKKPKRPKKKESKEAEQVSQDLLDNIFDSEDNN
jgi:hypothetical protein